jgi:HJR/Mrr/RecB family endonuclease
MNPMTFECFAAALWVAQGWRSVSRTQRNADAGVDVVARSGDLGILIQCKSSGSERALNWDAVKEVVGGRALYDRLYPSTTFNLACFTNAEFNQYAREQAQLNNVVLFERDGIAKLLDQYPLRFSDVERFLHQR